MVDFGSFVYVTLIFFSFFTFHYFLRCFNKYFIIFFHYGLFLPFLFPFQWLLMFCMTNWEAFKVFLIWMIWDLMTCFHFHNPKQWFCWVVEINVRSYNSFLFSFFSIFWYWKFEKFFQDISKICHIYNRKKKSPFFFSKMQQYLSLKLLFLGPWF